MSKKLSNLVDSLQKTYKVNIPSAREAGVVERLTLDSPGLNYAFGGGMPLGRMLFFQGPESGGKTTLATYLAMQTQQKRPDKKAVVFLDYEYTFDAEHAEEMGLDLDNDFYVVRPLNGEDGFNIMKEFANSGEVGLIIVDSISALASKAACEDAFGGYSGGKTAAVIADGIRMMLPYLYNNKCTLIMLSQERVNIGATYGADFKATGGRAPSFYSTWSARITRTDYITGDNKELAGIEMRVRNTKNKVGIARRDANLKLYFKGGIDSEGEYIDYLKVLGLITQKGSYYSNDDWGMKVQGLEAVKKFLLDRPELYESVKAEVNNIIAGHTVLDESEQILTQEEIESGAWNEYTEEDVKADCED